ncbi:MAG TPA: FAD-binding oxidoreductase [Bryobacteraceae bacterium]|nr:FAD-binding oxidoreductase [Bryobacteraceae bacterium]
MATSGQAASPGVLSEAVIRRFGTALDGEIVRPGEPSYDVRRKVFNGMIDRRPALIVRPANARAVQTCVSFARECGLLVSVKGGGHSVPGHAVCDEGLMIDLSLLKAIRVDPEARVAFAEGGVCWGEFDAATQQHGLAVTGGRVRSTGIAGLTLGSGSGWLERKLGYTVDSLTGADVVTAGGELLHASERENADLFWGLRGGGGNFGIVTGFEYRVHPIGPMVYGGMLGFSRHRASDILRRYRDFMEGAPDDVCGALALVTAPPAGFVPQELQGKPAIAIIVCYTGAPAEGEQAMRPILDLGPAFGELRPLPYEAVQGLLEGSNPPGRRNYWKADMYPHLPDEALERLLAATAETASPHTVVLVQPLGGAVHRVPDGATAIGWRQAKWSMHVLGMWVDAADDERNTAWVRGVDSSLKPWAQEGGYLNYLGDEGPKRVEQSFGAHYGRMVALKNKYDPTNFFRLNQNIKPAA